VLPGEGEAMSERHELEKRAEELADELGVDLGSRRLSNTKLAERVERLEQRKAEHDAKQRQKAVEEAHRESFVERLHRRASERVGSMRYAYQVAPGKQLQCRIGVLRSGVQVKREWVGGIDRLDELVELGSVLRGPKAKRFEVADHIKIENTTRGTLVPGDRVEPEYVGGEAKLEKLIAEGQVKRLTFEVER